MDIIKFIQSFSSPFLDDFFELVTMMGEDIFFLLVVTLILWCKNKEFGYKLGFAYLTNSLLNSYLKEIIKIPRPIGEPGIRSLRLETARGYSFPSGHAQRAASIWTSLMLYFRCTWVYVVGTIMIFMVVISRMYLGVHRLLDGVAGIVIGIIWVLIATRIMQYVMESGKKNILFLFAIPAIIGLFIIKTESFYQASGALMSFIIGYMIETEYINYKVKGKLWQQIIKYLFGINILFLLRSNLITLLPEKLISEFIIYFLLGIWVIVIAPLIFKTVFKENGSPTLR